jgi:two-component sensor histidine kinase
VALVGPWASDDLCGELSLLVSELVANAVAHGLPEVHLDVRMDGCSRIRVEVSDGSRALPELQPPTLERASGRGLQIVDAMASTWGAQLQPHGKVVWFELAATPCNATR